MFDETIIHLVYVSSGHCRGGHAKSCDCHGWVEGSINISLSHLEGLLGTLNGVDWSGTGTAIPSLAVAGGNARDGWANQCCWERALREVERRGITLKLVEILAIDVLDAEAGEVQGEGQVNYPHSVCAKLQKQRSHNYARKRTPQMSNHESLIWTADMAETEKL